MSDTKNIIDDELKGLLNEFSKQATQICDSFTASLKVEPPSIIYHYTDDTGLRGILESGKLWFTDIFQLNDPSELKHGVKCAIEILESKADTGSVLLKLFTKQFKETLELPRTIESAAHLFVCCFSHDRDDLGQWRAYADNGRGYSLGFDGPMFKEVFDEDIKKHAHLENAPFYVMYDEAKLCEILKELIATIDPILMLSAKDKPSLDIISYRTFLRNLTIIVVVNCISLSLLFKHKAYSNEKEYRFLQIHGAIDPVDNLKFRSRPYSLIRYRELDWKSVAPESLKEIMIGPAADETVARRFVDNCLSAYLPAATGTIKIEKSPIPYRNI
jgi:hypothetical protein